MGYSEDILKLTGGKGFGFASKGNNNNSDEETKNTKAQSIISDINKVVVTEEKSDKHEY